MKILSLAFIIILLLLSTCKKEKKEEIPKQQTTIELLQNSWIPSSSWIFFPDGSKYQLIPFDTITFTSDGRYIISYTVSDPTLPPPQLRREHLIEKYMLLPDDSTLIFSQLVDSTYQVTEGDTSVISSITNHLLVYYTKKNNIVAFLDSLKR